RIKGSRFFPFYGAQRDTGGTGGFIEIPGGDPFLGLRQHRHPVREVHTGWRGHYHGGEIRRCRTGTYVHGRVSHGGTPRLVGSSARNRQRTWGNRTREQIRRSAG